MARNSPGERIRQLREERRMTLKDIWEKTDITQAALSNIENGNVKQPKRESLDAIIYCLTAKKPILQRDERMILEGYGYSLSPILPSSRDAAMTKTEWRKATAHFAWPAYLLDYAKRVWEWNDTALAFLLGSPKDLRRAWLHRSDIFDVMFDAEIYGHLKILNREETLRKILHTMKCDYQAFLQEAWFQEFMERIFQKRPFIRVEWDSIGEKELEDLTMRLVSPVIFEHDGQIIRFHIHGTDLLGDSRFQIVQYIPLDEATTAHCQKIKNRVEAETSS